MVRSHTTPEHIPLIIQEHMAMQGKAVCIRMAIPSLPILTIRTLRLRGILRMLLLPMAGILTHMEMPVRTIMLSSSHCITKQ